MPETKNDKNILHIPKGQIEWFPVPWDTELMGFQVGQISKFDLLPGYQINEETRGISKAKLLETGVKLFNIRLPLDSLQKSSFLEGIGFRFIEVTHQPVYSDLTAWKIGNIPTNITVAPAKKHELPALMEIAGSSFKNERFHVDPHIETNVGNQRYANWVKTTYNHPKQTLHTFKIQNEIIGFFITETLTQKHIYWHLTAIAPAFQRKGYGFMAWQKMMQLHQKANFQRISTTIVAGNTPVLNLYAKLGFVFTNPEMGFHWWAKDIS